MKKLITVLLIMGIGLGFTLCQKPKTNETDTQANVSKDINSLEVDDNFNWKTIKDIQVSLTSSTDNVVFVKSVKGDVYLKALLKGGHRFDTKITIPTYVEEVLVVCNGQTQKLSVVDKVLTCSFN
jgi:hypothetical protein